MSVVWWAPDSPIAWTVKKSSWNPPVFCRDRANAFTEEVPISTPTLTFGLLKFKNGKFISFISYSIGGSDAPAFPPLLALIIPVLSVKKYLFPVLPGVFGSALSSKFSVSMKL